MVPTTSSTSQNGHTDTVETPNGPTELYGDQYILKKILTHPPQHQNAEKHQDAAKTVEVDLDIVACRCILMDKISGKPLDVVNIVLIAVFEIS